MNTEIKTIDDLLPEHICVKVAAELERQLLPKAPISIEGADVAGWSMYSSTIGGDFFDYYGFEGAFCSEPDRIRIVVGDASGHGFCSSLLMTSTRAYLRARAMQAESLDQLTIDVNRLLCMDTEASGHFVTAFVAAVIGNKGEIRWVRAGHDPALLYNPETERFETLEGEGIALGVDPHFSYDMNVRSGLAKGTIIVLATDGLWETKPEKDAVFGKAAVKDVIRSHHHASAAAIAEALKASVIDFYHNSKPDDDMTAVVIRFV